LGTLAILEKSTIGVSQKFIFSKMGEKLDFWWGIGGFSRLYMIISGSDIEKHVKIMIFDF